MNKKLLMSFLFLLIINSIFASVYRTPKKLSVISTKYFDIIFPLESEVAANIIAQKADGLYIDLCNKLTSEPYFRMPIVITQDNDDLNAYFTCYPYNKIVLLDTLPHSSSLSVFSETLINIFLHELTHAVSIQHKSDFFRAVSVIFGDCITPTQFVNLPLSFIEGVTVSFESLNSEGRLNDSYATHILKQAKLENCFPNWQEAAYTRDVYPVGSLPYIFGGAFNAYIQQRFGLAKYAEFWTLCGEKIIFESKLFKIVYGLSIDTAWNDFKNSIKIPATTENIFISSDSEGIHSKQIITFNKNQMINIADYPDRTILSTKNNQRISNLCETKSSVIWLDTASKGVFKIDKSDIQSNVSTRPKKIFSVDSSTNSISISKDKKYLVLSSIDANTKKNICKIYDIEKKKFINKFPEYTEGSIVELADDKRYFVGIKIHGQNSSLDFIDLLTNEVVFSKKNELYTQIFQPQDSLKGTCVYLQKERNDWSIIFYNPLEKDNLQEKQIRLENNPVMHSLKVLQNDQNNILTISFASSVIDSSLPRYAILDYTDETNISISEQSNDISGGVYSPIIIDNEVIFVAEFFDHDEIIKLPEEAFCVKEYKKQIEFVKIKEQEVSKLEIRESKPYMGLKYLTRGVFIPVTTIPFFENKENPISIPFGLTYITQTPIESWNFSLTGGFDFFSLISGAELAVSNSSLPVKIDFTTTFYGGMDDFWSSTNSVNLTYNLYLGLSHRYLTFTNNTSFAAQNGIEAKVLRLTNSDGFLFADYFQMMLSNIYFSSLSYYEKKGYSVGVGSTFASKHKMNMLQTSTDLFLTGIVNLYYPLLGENSNLKYTLNFPSSLHAEIFPDLENFVTFNVESVIFGVEIQKGLIFLPLYLARIVVKLDYSGNWTYPEDFNPDFTDPKEIFAQTENLLYQHSITGKFKCIFSPVLGNITNLKLNLGMDIRYQIDTDKFSYSIGGILDL